MGEGSVDRGARSRGRGTLAIAVMLGVAGLYLARVILVPLALAILLAFVLTPIVAALERRRLGRGLAVGVVALFAIGAAGALGWAATAQLSTLATELPRYRQTLQQRIAELRQAKPPALDQLQATVDELTTEQPGSASGGKSATPPAVVVKPTTSFGLGRLPSLLHALTSAGLVALLTIFALLEREELRNRLISLLGHGRLALTTRALDEASQRISRYLLTQCAVNGSFGVLVGLGLLVMGVPYALVWGILAGLLRFVPFLGFWAATAAPVLVTLATAPGWTKPLLVFGFLLGLDLLIAGFLEPMLYSHSAGVSRVALLLAVASLAWLWGPVGLLLATPIVVCLVVLGRHVPELRALAVLISDQPALDAPTRYYQRLLAGDEDEASELVEQLVVTEGRTRLFDRVLLPAMVAARVDRARRQITEDDEVCVVAATRRLVESLDENAIIRRNGEAGAVAPVTLIGCAPRDAMDALALRMLDAALEDTGVSIDILSPAMLLGEVVALVEARRPRALCIASVPPGGLAETRYFVKRLKACCPDMRIIVARVGGEGWQEPGDGLLAAGADAVVTTMAEWRDRILPFADLVRAAEAPAVAATEAA